MHNYGLWKHVFPKHFVWAILKMMMSGDHRVVFASSSPPPPPLPRSTAPSSAHWQLQTSWDRPSPSPAFPVWLHNQAGHSSHLSFLSGGGTPPFSEGRAHPCPSGIYFHLWCRRCKEVPTPNRQF